MQQLIASIEAEKEFTPQKVRKLVLAANVKAEDLQPWADYDHSPADSYGRKMVYDGGFFEVMVMSWCPGDFSAIHDHGYTQWGAVQAFGESEHALFFVQDGQINTLSRVGMRPGQVVAVGHELVHQMGNPTQQPFLTLHVYGNYDRSGNITSEARIFDLTEGKIQRGNGGAFFALPEEGIIRREAGPDADYLTWLRNHVELIRRVQRLEEAGLNGTLHQSEQLIDQLFDTQQWARFEEDLAENLDEEGHGTNSIFWKLLNHELKEAAALQKELLEQQDTQDSFATYAELYDAVIGKPCLENFMAGYLRFFADEFAGGLQDKTLLSIGCGTGLIEEHMLEHLSLQRENLLGIDISEAMVEVAQQRIPAEVGDALELDPQVQTWDIAYCGLNVFQYLDHQYLDHQYLRNVIRQTASILNEDGYFLGDFITPDHIRWYPNVIFSEGKEVASLRTPRLIEQDNFTYQESEIINVSRRHGRMRITWEGRHQRYLPPLSRVRSYFEEAFSQVYVYDAVSLKEIPEDADTCPSTRYLVVARN